MCLPKTTCKFAYFLRKLIEGQRIIRIECSSFSLISLISVNFDCKNHSHLSFDSIISHVLIVKGVVDHYRCFDHRTAKCTNPSLFFLIGFRVKIESHSRNLQFLHPRWKKQAKVKTKPFIWH